MFNNFMENLFYNIRKVFILFWNDTVSIKKTIESF